jgi:biopolymer transport protein ExbD
MDWKIRHEGSPKAVGGLTLPQVVEGLLDGRWEPTDEVMGPPDKTWVAIENHPQLAEVAADLEPPPPPFHEDESRLDMNALIDVCLVLLVFFILTTTYAELQKMMDSPNLAANDDSAVPRVTRQKVEETMIDVKVTQEKGKPVILVQGREVPKDSLAAALLRIARSQRKFQLLIEHDRDVPHGTIVAIEDAAKTARIDKVLIAVPKEELNK